MDPIWNEIDGKESDFDIIEEFNWNDYVFENKKNGEKYDVVCSVSNSTWDHLNSIGYCRQYAFRDTLKTRRGILQFTSYESQPPYYGNIFGDDFSVHQLIDEKWGDTQHSSEMFIRAETQGLTTPLHYEHVAKWKPDQQSKDVTGCPIFKILGSKEVHRFDPNFLQKIKDEVRLSGPVMGCYACYPDHFRISTDFIYHPQWNTKMGRFPIPEHSDSHAVLVIGYGAAIIRKNGARFDYLVFQNNWGTNQGNIVGRQPVKLFATLNAPIFKGEVNLEHFFASGGNEMFRLARKS